MSTTTLEPTQDLPGPLQHDGSALLLLLLGQQHFLHSADTDRGDTTTGFPPAQAPRSLSAAAEATGAAIPWAGDDPSDATAAGLRTGPARRRMT